MQGIKWLLLALAVYFHHEYLRTQRLKNACFLTKLAYLSRRSFVLQKSIVCKKEMACFLEVSKALFYEGNSPFEQTQFVELGVISLNPIWPGMG